MTTYPDLAVHTARQSARKRGASALGAILWIVSLCGAAWAADITTDTRIDDANVGEYASEPIAVAADATLTIALAPTTAEQVFAGAVSGAGKIVVANTGTKAVRFKGSFKDFTGELSASGDVPIGSTWENINLNGRLSGISVEGAGNKVAKFFGANVLGEHGAPISIGHQAYPKSTLNLNGFDQAVSALTFMGSAFDPETSASSYITPSYTLKSDTAATLTLGSLSWATAGGLYPIDHSGTVGVNGALSLVYAGTSAEPFAFHGPSTTKGGISIRSGGVVIASDATFDNLTSLAVSGTGSLTLQTTSVNSQNLALEIADSGTVTLPEVSVFRVKSLKVDGVSLAPDTYDADMIATLADSRLTGAAVEVLTREIGETKTFTWTGDGADDSLTTAANWQNGVVPTLTGGDEILVFAFGASATIPANADVYGLEIATAGDFTLRGEAFRLGAGGLSCGETEAARVCRFEAAPRTAGEQTWKIPANTVVELAAGWAGRSSVTLDRTTGTGDILKFSSDEPPMFAGSLIVTNDNILVLSGRGGIGAAGAHVQLNGKAGVRTTAACVTNRSAITFSHGPALNIAPTGTEFVQLGAITNASYGAYASQVTVAGQLRLNGGLGEAAAHQNSIWWTWRFDIKDSGVVRFGESPIDVAPCPVRVFGGTVSLASADNRYGVLTLLNGARAVCERIDALSSEGDVGINPVWAGALDLNGFDQTARDMMAVDAYGLPISDNAGYSDMYVTSATPATLKLTGAGTYAPHNLNFRGEASLHYAGTGRLALTNTSSTTTGSLTVSGGEVALLAGATWANCTNVVVSGSGKLTLDAGAAAKGAFSREATVYVSDGGTIEIPAGETVVVRYLYRDGEPAFSGRYSDGFVTGGGTLRVRKSSRKAGFRMLIK